MLATSHGWLNGWLALSSVILLTFSMATSVCARGAPTMTRQRKWATICLSTVALDYLVKYAVVGSGAALAGLVTFSLLASRSATTWCLNFSAEDTRARKALQRAICWVIFALCVGVGYASQIATKGWFDPFTLLVLAGNAFACLADCFNVVTWRRRSHFMMAAFMLAFGIYTASSALIAKAGIDLSACAYFDPLFGDHRRARIKDALRSILAPRWPQHGGRTGLASALASIPTGRSGRDS